MEGFSSISGGEWASYLSLTAFVELHQTDKNAPAMWREINVNSIWVGTETKKAIPLKVTLKQKPKNCTQSYKVEIYCILFYSKIFVDGREIYWYKISCNQCCIDSDTVKKQVEGVSRKLSWVIKQKGKFGESG